MAEAPWVEKYRPHTVDAVVYQEEVINFLKNCIGGGDFPNLLFYGPPGTGKTSTVLAVARDMFKDLYKNRVLELNASDERGINVIREKVKKFAQQTASGGKCPPFKIIVLDEADSMTSHAQACLRRVMEKESKSTRFAIICNYVSRIIDPIASRTSQFRFKPLKNSFALDKLKEICAKEDVEASDEVLNELLSYAEGDLRRAITYLQSASRYDEALTSEIIREVVGVIPQDWIDELIKAVSRDKSYDELEVVISDMIKEGFSGNQLIIQIHKWLMSDQCELNDTKLAAISEAIALVDFKLLEGASEFLQLMYLGSVMIEQFKVE